MPSAGNFKIEVARPIGGVCYSNISYQDYGPCLLEFDKVPHSELSDLLEVVERAMKEARLKLGKNAGEV